MNVYKDSMISDIFNFFIQNYNNKSINLLLNGNNELVCKRERMIKVGETSENINELSQEKITIIHKITNQIQLNKEFEG
jgi:hypothetical protein